MEKIDFIRLREDLIDYFGTAMFSGFGAAVVDLSRVENATNDELLLIALECRFDLENYIYEKGEFYDEDKGNKRVL